MPAKRSIDHAKLVFQHSKFVHIHPNTFRVLRKLTLAPDSGMSCELNLNNKETEVMICRYGSKNKIIAWTLKDKYGNIQLYVSPKYRNMGIGTSLTQQFVQKSSVKHCYIHDWTSQKFWSKLMKKTKIKNSPHVYW